MLRAAASDAERLANALSDPAWKAAATILKRDRESSVLTGNSALGAVVIKSMSIGGSRHAVSRLLGRTRLLREWRGNRLAADAGIAVAPLLALWRSRDTGGILTESLAMRRIEGQTLLEAMAAPSMNPAERLVLARAAGGLVARMLAAGLFNRDQKPSNIIISREEGGHAASGPRLVLLDPVGVRRLSFTSVTVARRRMLFSLIVEPTGCDIDVPMPWRLAAMHAALGSLAAGTSARARSTVRADFRAIDQMLFEHGDPTPSINPLRSLPRSQR